MKVFLNYLIAFLLVFIFLSCVSGKKNITDVQNPEFSKNSYRVMFYNVENLFDIENDPIKNDDEFTPEGSRYWSK